MNIAVIGTGSMGSALARHLAKGHSVFLCNRSAQKAQDLAKEIKATYSEHAAEAAKKADVILLAVKPKDLAQVAKEIVPFLTKKQILLSVLADTSMDVLHKHFPNTRVVRIMPNMALTSGQGIIGLAEHLSVSADVKQTTNALLEGLGLLYWLPEDRIDALAVLCASSPAFIYVLLEAMIQWGAGKGFPEKEAEELVCKTFEGALAVIRKSKKHPQELISQIASPGGITRKGLKVMEDRKMADGLKQALEASYE